MTTLALADGIRLRRRYARSVNLERDLARTDALEGYVPTDRAVEAFDRVVGALGRGGSHRAWTVTGVYGTGKSAFAHLLAVSFGPEEHRAAAFHALTTHPDGQRVANELQARISPDGFVRAVATARREPLAHTVLRALAAGAETFWAGRRGRRPTAVDECRVRMETLAAGQPPRLDDLPDLAYALAQASGTGLLLVIDEMGKNLEATARSGGADDLYLLQRLAELPAGERDAPVLVVGLLHQAFVEYGATLSAAQRAEWDKIQGRFEDLAFTESPEEMLRLMASVIDADLPAPIATAVAKGAEHWHARLSSVLDGTALADALSAQRLAAVYPLHPVTALTLPALCARYAQNDRSLFTFLASPAPNSLASFVATETAEAERLPLLRLPRVFDYFLDAGSPASRPQFQRWTEVHALVRDATGLSEDETAALKTIGALNLVALGGSLRASRGLVLAALCERASDADEERRWTTALDRLTDRRLLTYRTRVDEYRLWEGSDYNPEAAVQARLDADSRLLAEVLEAVAPMGPAVASRHSYQTGTLRYFEREYADCATDLEAVNPRSSESDGLLLYWVDETPLPKLPATLPDGRPLAAVRARVTHALSSAARDLAALEVIESDDPALARDGVARREVRQRLVLARRGLEIALRESFTHAPPETGGVLLPGRVGAALSDLCDRAYPLSPVLWNEMLNRRELTSQGARARRELLEAMLARGDQERLGIVGEGPDYAMYASVLLHTGIHRRDGSGAWGFGPPTTDGLRSFWDVIERFCIAADTAPVTLDGLYRLLEQPPYGIKPGAVPVVLAAVLLHHADDISVYRDGTFLPQLGPEHFELLVKQPGRFAVKHLALEGLRWEVFRDLAEELVTGGGTNPKALRVRNATLLGVVRPLVRFAIALPPVTRRANDLSPEATAVRDALLSATEPDRLLFEILPVAVGHAAILDPMPAGEGPLRLRAFRGALFRAIRELQGYYDRLLDHCRIMIHEAFGVQSDPGKLREDLRVRSQYLFGRCVEPTLRRLTAAAVEPDTSDRTWLESVVMVIADRPAETWTGDDALAFEINLGEVAHRFGRLEALLRETVADPHESFDARRVTVTDQDGRELQRVVWVERTKQAPIREFAQGLIHKIRELGDPGMREAVALAILDEVMGERKLNTAPPQADGRHETVMRRKNG
ncbi:MAG: hypothetical protein JWM27_4846 [Gemmatimonadetes bacterium]|nr:hypothetical protein [Gemmatimonadota bacterium]